MCRQSWSTAIERDLREEARSRGIRSRFAIALRALKQKPGDVVALLTSTQHVPEDLDQFIAFLVEWDHMKVQTSGNPTSPKAPEQAGIATREAWDVAEMTLEQCAEQGIEAVPFGDPLFPGRLSSLQTRGRASLGGYCPLLYVRGAIESLDSENSAAIIGTREPTEYGREKARQFGRRLAEDGVTVVSGLARGCDTSAHQGCLEGGGVGVAVMAHGLDRVYPPENTGLAGRLIATGGCLASEYPPGVPPNRHQFGHRDRLQAGLADLVVVIETPEEDGTMITVRYARKQGRRIACVSHPPAFVNRAEIAGNTQLLMSRTIALREPEDAVEAIHGRIRPAGDLLGP